jgi:hypothetical protein
VVGDEGERRSEQDANEEIQADCGEEDLVVDRRRARMMWRRIIIGATNEKTRAAKMAGTAIPSMPVAEPSFATDA